ncbi:MAG TPA: class I SAM-dependent methyltransferase [Pirellulales bacterium]|nr:class I SAM-dependent methyltransferase [Pirellulales bacterium]
MSFDTFDLQPGLTDGNRNLEATHHYVSAENKLFFGLFDSVNHRLLESLDPPTIRTALDELFLALRERRMHSTPSDWNAFVIAARRHPLMQTLHRDPFTVRAASRPRGYAGDAVMMDFIYGREEMWEAPESDPVGRAIFDYTTAAPASEGVRARRAFIASRIDRLAEEKHRPHVLAIAAGHLREAELSAAVRRRKTGRFVALDADPLSSAEIQKDYTRFGIETVTASFRRLFVDQTRPGDFDLVYSTGLFDYLNQRAGRRLVTSMFQMLRPDGTLLVANFLPGVRDIGYMETFMDWRLIYRSRREMADLTMDIPEDEIKCVSLFSEECRNIVFLQLTRN